MTVTPQHARDRHARTAADKVAVRLAHRHTSRHTSRPAPRHRAPAPAAPRLLALVAAVVITGTAITGSLTLHPAPRSAAQATVQVAEAPTPASLHRLAERALPVSRSMTRQAEAATDLHTYRIRTALAVADRKAAAEQRRLARIAAAKAAARQAAARAARQAAAEKARKAAARDARRAAEKAREAQQQATLAAAATDPGTLRDLARQMMLDAGWGPDQWPYLDQLVARESGWNPTAQNASSGAYGLPQALPGAKMASVAADWRTNPATQLRWMFGYLHDRYGSPQAAWAHSQSTGWY